MKLGFLSLLLGSAALLAPQTSSATLLVGYYSFDNTTANDTTPNEFLAGFSGTLTKSGVASSATGGSTDKTYGPDGLTGLPTNEPAGTPNNGYLAKANGVTLTVTNGSSSIYSLTSLLFDASKSGGGNLNYTVAWTSPAGNGNSGAAQSVGGGFADYIVNLGGIALGVGQSIVFTWTTTTSQAAVGHLDNIALNGLVPIPEPGSMLALGCLVGSGLLLRSRRRPLAAMPA